MFVSPREQHRFELLAVDNATVMHPNPSRPDEVGMELRNLEVVGREGLTGRSAFAQVRGDRGGTAIGGGDDVAGL